MCCWLEEPLVSPLLFCCSQLAEVLFDDLQLSPSAAALPGGAGSDGKALCSSSSSRGRSNSSSSSSSSRSTGAEALQALLREARSKETDPHASKVAA